MLADIPHFTSETENAILSCVDCCVHDRPCTFNLGSFVFSKPSSGMNVVCALLADGPVQLLPCSSPLLSALLGSKMFASLSLLVQVPPALQEGFPALTIYSPDPVKLSLSSRLALVPRFLHRCLMLASQSQEELSRTICQIM